MDFCKKRWRSLRDTFIKVYKTVENTSAGSKKKSWSYYEMMTFIIPHIESREAFGNYSQAQQQDSSTVEDETVVVALECDDAISTKSNQSGTSEDGVNTSKSRYSFTKQRERMHDSVDEILNKILCKEEDPDEHFLLSLLPSLRRLNPQQNALANIKIQILYEIEFTDSSRSNEYSSITPVNYMIVNPAVHSINEDLDISL